jgi:hypothetical protein
MLGLLDWLIRFLAEFDKVSRRGQTVATVAGRAFSSYCDGNARACILTRSVGKNRLRDVANYYCAAHRRSLRTPMKAMEPPGAARMESQVNADTRRQDPE